MHRARVFGRCADSTGIAPFTALVQQVMTQQPYASADRVFWIVDNGSSHRGRKAIDRLAEQFPNAIMLHTPVHASWLNQIEIFFSIVQRNVVTPNDFTDLGVVSKRVANFETRYNQTGRPSNGTSPPPTSTTSSPGSSATTSRPKTEPPNNRPIANSTT